MRRLHEIKIGGKTVGRSLAESPEDAIEAAMGHMTAIQEGGMSAREARAAMRKQTPVSTAGARGVIKREFKDYYGKPKFMVGPKNVTEPNVDDPRFRDAYAKDIYWND